MRIRAVVNLTLIALGAAALLFLFITGCASPRDLSNMQIPYSLCALDFKDKSCWREKSKNDGYTFGELELQNSRCGGGPPDSCWFGISDSDLTRLLQRSEELDEMRKSCKP